MYFVSSLSASPLLFKSSANSAVYCAFSVAATISGVHFTNTLLSSFVSVTVGAVGFCPSVRYSVFTTSLSTINSILNSSSSAIPSLSLSTNHFDSYVAFPVIVAATSFHPSNTNPSDTGLFSGCGVANPFN